MSVEKNVNMIAVKYRMVYVIWQQNGNFEVISPKWKLLQPVLDKNLICT